MGRAFPGNGYGLSGEASWLYSGRAFRPPRGRKPGILQRNRDSMADTRYDVATIGNAIVDIIAQTDDKFLQDQELIKGAMTLIDADRSMGLYGRMGRAIEASGGSAADQAAGVRW